MILSQSKDRAICPKYITALYTQKIKGRFTVFASIDTDSAHLPASFALMPIQTVNTSKEAQEILKRYSDSLTA